MNIRQNTKVVDFEDTIFGFLLCCVCLCRKEKEGITWSEYIGTFIETINSDPSQS